MKDINTFIISKLFLYFPAYQCCFHITFIVTFLIVSHTILAVNTHHIGKIVKIDAFLEVFVQIKGAHRVQRLILHKNQPKGCLK